MEKRVSRRQPTICQGGLRRMPSLNGNKRKAHPRRGPFRTRTISTLTYPLWMAPHVLSCEQRTHLGASYAALKEAWKIYLLPRTCNASPAREPGQPDSTEKVYTVRDNCITLHYTYPAELGPAHSVPFGSADKNIKSAWIGLSTDIKYVRPILWNCVHNILEALCPVLFPREFIGTRPIADR